MTAGSVGHTLWVHRCWLEWASISRSFLLCCLLVRFLLGSWRHPWRTYVGTVGIFFSVPVVLRFSKVAAECLCDATVAAYHFTHLAVCQECHRNDCCFIDLCVCVWCCAFMGPENILLVVFIYVLDFDFDFGLLFLNQIQICHPAITDVTLSCFLLTPSISTPFFWGTSYKSSTHPSLNRLIHQYQICLFWFSISLQNSF